MSASAAESDRMIADKLDGLVAKWTDAGFGLKVHLFKTNVANVPGVTGGDFTECDFGSYAPDIIPVTDLGAATVTDHVAFVESTVVQTWTNTGSAQNVYGYWVEDTDAEEYLCGETFASPVALLTGQSISIQLRVKDRSQMF